MSRYYYAYPFGQNADDLTSIPTAAAVDGSVSYFSGWTDPYEYNLLTNPDALPIPRGQTNQLMYDITNNIQQYQQLGIPAFITSSDNQGSAFPYAKWAWALYDALDGKGPQPYYSLIDSNTNLPTITAAWRLATNLVSSIMLQSSLANFAIDTGTANTYVASPVVPYLSVVQGSILSVQITHANTGVSTLNTSTLGALSISKVSPVGLIALQGGELVSGMIAKFQNTGSTWILLNPANPASYSASIYKTGVQTLTANTDNLLQFDTLDFSDPYGTLNFNLTTHVITTTVAGKLRIAANANVSGFQTPVANPGDCSLRVYKNGSRYDTISQIPSTGNDIVLMGDVIIPCAPSDAFTIYAHPNTATNLQMLAGTVGNFFQVEYLGV